PGPFPTPPPLRRGGPERSRRRPGNAGPGSRAARGVRERRRAPLGTAASAPGTLRPPPALLVPPAAPLPRRATPDHQQSAPVQPAGLPGLPLADPAAPGPWPEPQTLF